MGFYSLARVAILIEECVRTTKNQTERQKNLKTITKFLKCDLNLSFKKATSRPMNLNVTRQKLLKIFFSARIAKQLEKWKYIVNIDEASISRLTTRIYSWLIRDVLGSIKNISFS